jgi:hypothetical protein
MATKFITAKFGPELLAWLRAHGSIPTTKAEVRDVVDRLDATWPASAAQLETWVQRIRDALLLEAFNTFADAPAHRRVSASVEAELDRKDLNLHTFADRVGIPTGRLSQLLNCYVRWTHEEVAAVGKALRLAVSLPPDQGALSLAAQPPKSISDHGVALERIAHLEAALDEARKLHQQAAAARDQARAAISECRKALFALSDDLVSDKSNLDRGVLAALMTLKGQP